MYKSKQTKHRRSLESQHGKTRFVELRACRRRIDCSELAHPKLPSLLFLQLPLSLSDSSLHASIWLAQHRRWLSSHRLLFNRPHPLDSRLFHLPSSTSTLPYLLLHPPHLPRLPPLPLGFLHNLLQLRSTSDRLPQSQQTPLSTSGWRSVFFRTTDGGVELKRTKAHLFPSFEERDWSRRDGVFGIQG